MSVLALHPFDTNTRLDKNNHAQTNSISIGFSHSYCFYQQLNTTTKESVQRQKPKQIIPSIPRKHAKIPKNSSLSPIRSQKIMPTKAPTAAIKSFIDTKRPYPLVSTFSSPASMQTVKRQRKVSFNEKVVVVCTVFDDEDEEQVPEGCERIQARRHSTGEPYYPKSILIYKEALPVSPPITQKITQSLKQFKNRLLFT